MAVAAVALDMLIGDTRFHSFQVGNVRVLKTEIVWLREVGVLCFTLVFCFLPLYTEEVFCYMSLPCLFCCHGVWTTPSFLSLKEQRHLTHENVQRKQARTGEEREEEEEEQISESESEDEENEIIYNPKNLPLGWDGKVIETVRPGEVGEVRPHAACV